MAQGKDSDELQELAQLRAHLEEQLKWGDVESWHSSMFTELSERIFKECQVMLSVATLKRFWGVVKHEGAPSISTLDTLAKFGGFSNWRDFKLSRGQKTNSKTPPHIPRKTLYVTAGFLIAIVVIGLVGGKRVIDPDQLALVSFSSRPVTNSYPNSVVFDFDLKSIRSNNLKIQQYWDPTKTIKIDAGQKQATGIYYFPGYFKAKLLVDGETIREHDLFLRSQGWMGSLDYKPVPKYFSFKGKESGLRPPPSIFDEVVAQENPISTTYHYVNELGNISGDNFTLSSSIKINWSEKWGVCQAVRIYILGSDGAMIFPFSKIGCSSENNLMLNDMYLSGKEHDLSFFSADLSDLTHIKLEVRNRNATVYINDTQVYEGAYLETMGRVVGLRFKFLGMGEVTSFSLNDLRGETVLELPQ